MTCLIVKKSDALQRWPPKSIIWWSRLRVGFFRKLLVVFDSVDVCSLSFYFSHKVKEKKISSVSLTSKQLVSAWNIHSFFAQLYARRLFILQSNPRLSTHLHFDNVTILGSDYLSHSYGNNHRLLNTCTWLLLTSLQRLILVNIQLYCSPNTLMKQLISHLSISQF